MCRAVLFTLASLSVILAILWVVSYRWIIHIEVPGTSPDSTVAVEQMYGRISIFITHYSPPSTQRGSVIYFSSISETRSKIEMTRSLGIMMDKLQDMPSFEWSSFAFPPINGVTWSGRTVTFPHWIPFLLTGAWPAWAAAMWIRRRTRKGFCSSCGYDLRASPSGACPECGAANHCLHLLGDTRDG